MKLPVPTCPVKLTGDIYTVAGTKGTAGFKGDGAAAPSAQLNFPKGLALLPETGNKPPTC